ncbi:DMT family transporter [Streptomyces sp. NPDC002928]|uniref:DMT family transporter n=1 Tax=Streptomyces sp. NPDC002928 TaxID=3154440 RepID=UPI0033A77B2D
MIALSVLCAVLAAASNATGTVLQRRAAMDAPASDALSPRLLLDLARRPVWLGGILGVVFAAIFQALALAFGPLALVQPVFVLELPFALLIAVPVLHRTLPSAGWRAIAAMVVGLALALAAAAPHGGTPRPSWVRLVPAVVGCAGAMALLVAAARRRPFGAVRAVCLAGASAIGNALAAMLMKVSMDVLSHSGVTGFLTAWQTYGFAVAGITAVFLLENALQAGPLPASQPALTLGDALVSLLLGLTVFGEHIRSGWWLLPALTGVVLIVVGSVRLSRLDLLRAGSGGPPAPAP